MARLWRLVDKIRTKKKKKNDGSNGGSPPSVTLRPGPVVSVESVEPAVSATTQTATPIAQLPAEQIAQPSASASTSTPPLSPDIDLWARAFDKFGKTELAEDYRKHLASLQGDNDTTNTCANVLTPQYAERVVQKLLEDREQRQWRVSLLGHDVTIREQTERLAKFLLWSDPIVQKALDSQPYAALAWSGVSILLPLLSSSVTQNKAMLDGLNSVSEMQLYWNIWEETYLRSPERPQYENLIEPLVELYLVVVEYQARVICHLSKAQLTRAWTNVTGWNDWAGEAASIKTKSNMCKELISPLTDGAIHKHWRLQMDEMQQSREILDEIREAFDDVRMLTQKAHKDERETHLLHDLAANHEGYKNINPKRVEGTCEWFFADDRFHTWRDSSTSRLLWVTADPGCGKSVLSRALVDESRLSTHVSTSTVCHFFFKDGNEGQMRSTDALSAVLHQLFTQDLSGGLLRYALLSHKNYGKGLTQNFSELWKILLQCAKSSDAGEIVCILDALDECEERSRNELISALDELYCQQRNRSESSRVKFLITSRPYDKLEEKFARFSATKYMRFDGDDKSSEIAREINLVIDMHVGEIARTLSEQDRRKISDRLKSMENRTYLWLYLIMDTIKMALSHFKKSSNIESLLSDIPPKVSEAYELILSRKQDEAETEMLLSIVLTAARPLTLDEASFALTSAEEKRSGSGESVRSSKWPKEGFKSTVKNLCGLFITVHDSRLSFIHQTAREFLVNPKRHGTWEGRFHMPQAHKVMSLVCMDYLLLPNLAKTGREAETLFLAYASEHWPLHFVSQEAQSAAETQHSARQLCDMSHEGTSLWMGAARVASESQASDLSLASSLGLKSVVEAILSEDTAAATSKYYNTALLAASRCGHHEVVDLLIQNGADPKADVGYYGTALHAASRYSHVEVVAVLLRNGADANASCGYFVTPLQAASYNGKPETVSLLLQGGADVNHKGGRNGTALQIASHNGHYQAVSLLLDHGANVDGPHGICGPALDAASRGGYINIVRLLLQKGADVDAPGVYKTALYGATAHGHPDIVQLLLDNGATP